MSLEFISKPIYILTMKKIRLSGIILFSVSVFFQFFVSCSKKDTEISAANDIITVKAGSHSWYCFTGDGFAGISRPQNAPEHSLIPWTEAVRISSANSAAETDFTGSEAFAVVNRLGILRFSGEEISLSKDMSLFSDRTAGNLVFYNGTPLFSVYKSVFFNDTVRDSSYIGDSSRHLFLVQFDTASGISYPVVNSNNLTDEPNSEITDFFWDGLDWLCCVKTVTDVRNYFSYITWRPSVSLLSVSPATASSGITVSESDSYTFRRLKEQNLFSYAPERIQRLLLGAASSRNFYIEVKTAGGTSPRRYENYTGEDDGFLEAKAIMSKAWSAALFQDGTFYIEGALPGKYILRGGKAVAMRLPKLPAGYIYSDFAVSGTTLYVAWEESSFYRTGRSGFLTVDLNRILYPELPEK